MGASGVMMFMRLVTCLGGMLLIVSGCDRFERRERTLPVKSKKEALDRVRQACSSRLTYDRLKEYVFDEAARIRNSDPRRLDSLAAYSVARMDDPVLKRRDDDLNITVCSGRFVLDLPPGVQDAFDGRSAIQAEVEYSAQEAVDGSGLVYSMSGAEPIIYRIATLGLPQRPVPPIPAAPTVVAESARPEAAQTEPEPLPPPSRNAAEQTPKKANAPAPARVEQARSEPKPVRQAGKAASPSFSCSSARTRSEKMVCGNGSLAAADRRMSAVYYSRMANADLGAKRALRQSRDKFLARRERCSSEACISRVYEERVLEIRSITAK